MQQFKIQVNFSFLFIISFQFLFDIFFDVICSIISYHFIFIFVLIAPFIPNVCVVESAQPIPSQLIQNNDESTRSASTIFSYSSTNKNVIEWFNSSIVDKQYWNMHKLPHWQNRISTIKFDNFEPYKDAINGTGRYHAWDIQYDDNFINHITIKHTTVQNEVTKVTFSGQSDPPLCEAARSCDQAPFHFIPLCQNGAVIRPAKNLYEIN